MEQRPDRWPSSWAIQLTTTKGSVVVRVSNVSSTGLRFKGPRPPRIGEMVSFTAMGKTVPAQVVRREKDGGALAFHTVLSPAQLSNLRQYRELPS